MLNMLVQPLNFITVQIMLRNNFSFRILFAYLPRKPPRGAVAAAIGYFLQIIKQGKSKVRKTPLPVQSNRSACIRFAKRRPENTAIIFIGIIGGLLMRNAGKKIETVFSSFQHTGDADFAIVGAIYC